MSLRITLKPNERVIIGGAVIRNGPSRIEFYVENEVALLRESDILSPKAANTPCRRIYLALQLMYVDPDRLTEHRDSYTSLVQDVLTAAPSSKQYLERIDDHAAAGRYYQAIKSAQALLDYEQELLSHGT